MKSWIPGWLAVVAAGLVGTCGVGAAESDDVGAAWRALVAAADPPEVPTAWETNAPSPAEVQKFLGTMADSVERNAAQARAFHEKFPQDRRASEARLLEVRQLALAVHFGKTNRLADLKKARERLPERLADEERFFIESGVAYRLLYLEQSVTGLINLADFEKEVRRLDREFKNSSDVHDLFLELARAHFAREQFDKAKAVAAELYAKEGADSLQESAHSIIRRVGMLGKPLALRFTAMDGRKVDLEKLRGKVVMIDAWATFCTICMKKLPEIRAVHAALKDKGFEVVGLNFDEEREVVEKAVAKEKIPWPNHFDGQGWENKYGREFEIVSLPAVWLVDKKGVVRELNAHVDIRRKVERLLAE